MTIQQKFESVGGHFLSPEKEIISKLEDVRCFIFDWDGVFNNGVKVGSKGSPFSEADSMGLNMLRFSYWLIQGDLPIIAIITGENNISALNFADREHLDAVFLNSKNKKEALAQLTNDFGISTDQILFVFDDILDLNVAKNCLISICVKRNSSPLFHDFIIENKLCDYITGHVGGDNAIREISELLIGLKGNYAKTINNRMKYNGEYENYLSLRKTVNPIRGKTSTNN